jgi:hypothetical protein
MTNKLHYTYFKVKAIKVGESFKEKHTHDVSIKSTFFFWKIPMLFVWAYYMI